MKTIGHFILGAAILIGGCNTKPEKMYTGAQVWKLADDAVKPTSDLLVAIEIAQQIVQKNLENADSTGWKQLSCVVESEKARIVSDMEQGSMRSTGRPLDIALSGKGFLAVKTPNGIAYTRNGNLFVNDKSQLVVGPGDMYPIHPPITFPQNVQQISISQEGVISVFVANDVVKQQVGQIQIAMFLDPEMLKRDGQFFLESKNSGEAHMFNPGGGGTGRIFQNFLESSNVSILHEQRRKQFLDNWVKTITQ